MTLWTVDCQDPLSVEFSRQEYWSGLPFPPAWIFLTQGSNSHLLHCRQFLYCWAIREAPSHLTCTQNMPIIILGTFASSIYLYFFPWDHTEQIWLLQGVDSPLISWGSASPHMPEAEWIKAANALHCTPVPMQWQGWSGSEHSYPIVPDILGGEYLEGTYGQQNMLARLIRTPTWLFFFSFPPPAPTFRSQGWERNQLFHFLKDISFPAHFN